MIFKRSVVNYIIWGLLCVVVFAGIGVSAIGVSEAASNPAYLFYVAGFYAIFIFGITLLALGYKTLKNPIEDKIGLSNVKLEGVMEIVFVFVAAITALIVRFASAITMFLDEAGARTTKGTGAYIEYSLGNIPNLGTGENGAYIFTGILKGLFNIFGENVVVVFVLQALLSLGIMLFIFYGLRDSVGKVAAWISFLLLAFLPASIQQFLYCTPALMYGFILSAYFFGLTELIKFYKQGKFEENKQLIYFALLGVFAGFIAYFDISGLILFPITIYAFYQMKVAEVRDKYDNPKNQSLVFAGCGLAFLLIALFGFPAGSPSGMTGIARYGMLFVPREGIDFTVLSPFYGTWESAFIYMFAGLWLLEFVKTKKDRAFPFAVMAVILALFHFLTLDHVSYEVVMSVALTVIGAIGLRCIGILFMPVEAESDEALIEQLIEIENKRKERANKKFAKKIEKQNKLGAKSKSKIITLGKDVHMEEPAAETETSVEKPATEETVAETPAGEAPAETTTAEAFAEETETKEPAEEKPAEEVPAEEPAKEAPIEEPVAETPEAEVPAEEPVAETPEAEVPAEEPVAETPEVEAPAETPATETVAEEAPASETPASETPASETPATETPAAEAPAEEPAPEPKPVKKELPPYVPAKMVARGRRGKMFSPVKKAEGDFEVNIEYMNTPMVKKTEESEIMDTAVAAAVVGAGAVAATVASTNTEENVNAAADASANEVTAIAETVKEAVVSEAVNETVTEAVSEVVGETAGETIAETVNEVAGEAVSEAPASEVVNEAPVAEAVSESAVEAVSETASEVTVENAEPEVVVASVPSAPVVAPEAATEAATEATVETAVATKASETAETVTSETTTETKADAAETENASATNEIKNVLPGPKPHVPRELAFDYDPSEEEMDFDIKDLTGKDFYDV